MLEEICFDNWEILHSSVKKNYKTKDTDKIMYFHQFNPANQNINTEAIFLEVFCTAWSIWTKESTSSFNVWQSALFKIIEYRIAMKKSFYFLSVYSQQLVGM